jgi:hypothetical protein
VSKHDFNRGRKACHQLCVILSPARLGPHGNGVSGAKDLLLFFLAASGGRSSQRQSQGTTLVVPGAPSIERILLDGWETADTNAPTNGQHSLQLSVKKDLLPSGR